MNRILFVLLLAAAFGAASAEKRLPWPDRAYARVTETQSMGGNKSTMTYRMAYERKGDHAEVRFHGVDSGSINGEAYRADELPPTQLVVPDMKLDAQGQPVGLLDAELYRGLAQAAAEAADDAADEAQRAALREATSDARTMQLDEGGKERLLAWTEPYRYWPAGKKRRAKFEDEAPFYGVVLPYRVDTAIEPARSDDQVVLHFIAVNDARGRGEELVPAAQDFALRTGVGPSVPKGDPAKLELRVVRDVTTTYERDSRLPLLVSMRTTGTSGEQETMIDVEYRFEWQDKPFDDPNFSVAELAEPSDLPPPKVIAFEAEPTDSKGNREPSLATRVTPRYPSSALRQRFVGDVTMKVKVDPAGRVEEVEITESSGYASLDAAAVEAVKASTFHPELVKGKAVESWVLLPMSFNLEVQ